MATRRSLFKPVRLTSFVAAALATSFVVLPAASSSANPQPSLSQVKRQVEALQAQADVAVEKYDAAQTALTNANKALAAAQVRVAREMRALSAQRKQIGAFAAELYRGGGAGNGVLALMTSASPETFLSGAATLDQVSQAQADRLRSLESALTALTSAQIAAHQQAAQQAKATRALAAERASINRNLARQQALMASLQASQRRALQAQMAAPVHIAAPVNVPVSGRASVAVNWAYRELGKPYSYGAAGPDAFDCSGLTMYVWGKAGVYLPHNSASQYYSIPHVDRSQLQPGDLVFFYSDIHHVGIYIGNGDMIAAPHTGTVVQIQAVYWNEYVGAGRP